MPKRESIMKNIEMIKSLIEMASSFEDADSIIIEFTHLKDTKNKLEFLYENFDVSIVGANDVKQDESYRLLTDYEAVLTAIVNKKWR